MGSVIALPRRESSRVVPIRRRKTPVVDLKDLASQHDGLGLHDHLLRLLDPFSARDFTDLAWDISGDWSDEQIQQALDVLVRRGLVVTGERLEKRDWETGDVRWRTITTYRLSGPRAA